MAICISPRPLTAKIFGSLGLRDAQRDVGADFLHQPLPDVARGDELAVLPGERAVVDGEFHLDGRRINRDVRQRRARFGVADRFADEHVLETGEADDVARVRLLDFDALHAFEMEDRGDFALGHSARRRGGRWPASPTLTLPS